MLMRDLDLSSSLAVFVYSNISNSSTRGESWGIWIEHLRTSRKTFSHACLVLTAWRSIISRDRMWEQRDDILAEVVLPESLDGGAMDFSSAEFICDTDVARLSRMEFVFWSSTLTAYAVQALKISRNNPMKNMTLTATSDPVELVPME